MASEAVHTHLPWCEKQEKLLKSWAERAAGYRWLHNHARLHYKKEIIEPFAGCLITTVSNKPIGLKQACGTHKLVGVPPEGWAAGRAAGTKNALVKTVKLFPLLGRLEPFFLRRWVLIDEKRLDGMVLLEELGHVDDQVANNR